LLIGDNLSLPRRVFKLRYFIFILQYTFTYIKHVHTITIFILLCFFIKLQDIELYIIVYFVNFPIYAYTLSVTSITVLQARCNLFYRIFVHIISNIAIL